MTSEVRSSKDHSLCGVGLGVSAIQDLVRRISNCTGHAGDISPLGMESVCTHRTSVSLRCDVLIHLY